VIFLEAIAGFRRCRSGSLVQCCMLTSGRSTWRSFKPAGNRPEVSGASGVEGHRALSIRKKVVPPLIAAALAPRPCNAGRIRQRSLKCSLLAGNRGWTRRGFWFDQGKGCWLHKRAPAKDPIRQIRRPAHASSSLGQRQLSPLPDDAKRPDSEDFAPPGPAGARGWIGDG